MNIRFRGKNHSFTALDDAVALRATGAQRGDKQLTVKETLRTANASAANDDRDGNRFGVRLPGAERRIYERAGWAFAQADDSLMERSRRRATVADRVQAWPVIVGRGNTTLIVTDLVTVKLPDAMDHEMVEKVLRSHHLQRVRNLRFARNLFEARMTGQDPLEEQIAALQSEPSGPFEFVEPAFLQALSSRAIGSTVPAPHAAQWQHFNAGGSGGVSGADGRTLAAWSLAKGTSVKLAFVDNGFHVGHPDLSAGLFRGGHFSDDGLGTGPFIPRNAAATGFPADNHGTFCLGMAGSRFTSAPKVFGSAPECDLIPIACLEDQVGTQATLARAIAYAADPTTEEPGSGRADGADVIGCSLGPNGGDWTLTSVLDLAIEFVAANGRGGKGTPLFWAVANDPVPVSNDEVSSHPQVVAVGRSNRHDQADGSAYGERLAVLAPGTEVYSTFGKNGHRAWTGTSFACPFAAGVAALVLERFPAMTADEVVLKVTSTCDKVGGVAYDASGHHDHYGYGRINAEQAVT